jgi:hypothetical protein
MACSVSYCAQQRRDLVASASLWSWVGSSPKYISSDGGGTMDTAQLE